MAPPDEDTERAVYAWMEAREREAAIKAYFDGYRKRLDTLAARYLHIRESRQAFNLYHQILDEIENAISESRELDVQGLWEERTTILAGAGKPGMSFQALDAYVAATSDNQAAQQLNQTRARLFQSIQRRSKQAA